jgi:short-subunit dehydrogenase
MGTEKKICLITGTTSGIGKETAMELASRLNGYNVTVNCLTPGWVYTGLFRDTIAFVKLVTRWLALTPAQGAATTIFLATSDQVQFIRMIL